MKRTSLIRLGGMAAMGAVAITATIIGTIGGASLGAALGYLERRELTGERKPRVR
jgi:hypothetical protein